MDTPLRIGLIGAHYGASLASGFSALENADVVAIADSDSAALNEAGDALGIAHRFESLEDMLLESTLDALIVASPTHLHERHVGAAFDRGLHVLCALPIGTRSSEVSHVVTSSGLVGKVFMLANPLRYDPRILKAREQNLGEILFATGSAQVADWPYPADSWRLERDLGGGALLEVGAPILDALWFAMGCPDPMEAMAAGYHVFSSEFATDCEHPAEDTLAGMVRFKNGSSLQFLAQLNAALPSGEERRTLSLTGSRAELDLESGTRSETGGLQENYAKSSDAAKCLGALAAAFISAIETGEADEANGKQALAFHKMTDALLSSAREKEAVSIKVERSLDDLFGGL